MGHHASDLSAPISKGGDKGSEYDGASFDKKFADFANSSQVLFSVFVAKAEITTQTVPYIITIQHKGPAAYLV